MKNKIKKSQTALIKIFFQIGLIFSTILLFIPSLASATTTTIQPGVEGKDAYVSTIQFPNQNYGSTTNLAIGRGAADFMRSYLQFDLSSIPAGVTINSAVLSLYFYQCPSAPMCQNTTFYLYRVTSAWQESTITVSHQPASDGVARASTTVNMAAGWYSWNIKNLTQNWINGTTNYGVLVRGNDADPPTVTSYYSSDYGANPTLRPKLSIDYSGLPPTPPGPPPGPGPGGDTAPPQISNIRAQDIGKNSAKITWTTDEPATSLVYYGTTESNSGSASSSSLTTSHSLSLSNLSSSTKYQYRVSSRDAAQNQATSDKYQFTTLNGGTSSDENPKQTPEKPAEKSDIASSITQPNSPFGKILNTLQRAIPAAVVGLALLSSLISLALNLPLVNPFVYLYHILVSLLSISGYKRRKSPWGQVYDVQTGKPIAGARVQLFKADSGRLVETQITDLAGRFGFLIEPGKYQIKVINKEYLFPSKIVAKAYRGEIFESRQGVVNLKIPLDPNLSVMARKISRWQKAGNILEKISLVLLVLGNLMAIFFYLKMPDTVNLIIILIYSVLWLIEFFKYQKARPFGLVSAALNRKPLDLAILRLFNHQGKLTQTKVTGLTGRYFFLTSPGDWKIAVVKQNFQPEQKYLKIKKTGAINYDIILNKTKD